MSGIQTVLRLLEIVGFRVAVDVVADFVDARQRVQHAQIRLAAVEHGVVQVVEVFNAFLFEQVGESFALHARHIQYVGFVNHLLREFLVFVIFNAVGLAELFVFDGHLQLVARHKVEAGVEITHSHEQRVHGATIFQVAHHSYGEVVERALSFAY